MVTELSGIHGCLQKWRGSTKAPRADGDPRRPNRGSREALPPHRTGTPTRESLAPPRARNGPGVLRLYHQSGLLGNLPNRGLLDVSSREDSSTTPESPNRVLLSIALEKVTTDQGGDRCSNASPEGLCALSSETTSARFKRKVGRSCQGGDRCSNASPEGLLCPE